MEQAPQQSGGKSALHGSLGILSVLGTYALARLANDQGWLCGS
jgi:hypothetical protein